ncbi:MAG: efflux RND transporter periplasmic adaptor subunit [Candidatus Aminicenantes bacterium]|nr:efflux RND transporter periplasmic adaptor subunit [Candidatus Aminicenantes bacterium]
MIKKTLAIILVGLFGLLFNDCGKNPHGQPRHGEKTVSGKASGPYNERIGGEKEILDKQVIHLNGETQNQVGIKTAVVKPGLVKTTLQAMGKVLAPNNRKALVGFAGSARIVELHAAVGNWVEAGQPLVTLVCEEVGNAQSDFVKALTDCELAKLGSDREERLFKKDIGAKKEFLEAKANYEIARANLNAAEKKLYVLGFSKKQIEKISVTKNVNPNVTLSAPISGRVVRNNALLGAVIDSAAEIMTIIDPTDLWIDAEIFEKDLSKVKLDQEVDITVPAYPGETFSGKIHYIGDIVNPETRTITVRTKVVNRDFRLKPGMFADIKLLINHKEDAVIVPKQAVLDDGELKILFVMDVDEPDHFVCRVVEVGVEYNGDIEILRGLAIGEQVVIEGNYQLKSRLHEETLKGAHVH